MPSSATSTAGPRPSRTAGDPVISVDAKKKEMVGEFGNAGRQWRPGACPAAVRDHDFASEADGKAIPYGIYDLAANAGWVNVGTDHDTAAFAVESIRRWWNASGRAGYPQAGRLLVAADAGGSNGYRTRAWKAELAALALDTGLAITVCHFPPGTSKWNKIEHRLFSRITMNWRGRPLASHQVIVESIAATTTATGLRVHAELDPGSYPAGDQVSKPQIDALPLTRHDWHGEWNYTLRPEPPAPPLPAPPPGPGRAAWAHPALTGLDPAAWDQLITTLHARLGDPPAGRRPSRSTSPTRPSSPCSACASGRTPPPSPSCSPSPPPPSPAAHSRIWPLLVQAGYPTELAGPQLKTLTDLTAYAHANGLNLTTTHPS